MSIIKLRKKQIEDIIAVQYDGYNIKDVVELLLMNRNINGHLNVISINLNQRYTNMVEKNSLLISYKYYNDTKNKAKQIQFVPTDYICWNPDMKTIFKRTKSNIETNFNLIQNEDKNSEETFIDYINK